MVKFRQKILELRPPKVTHHCGVFAETPAAKVLDPTAEAAVCHPSRGSRVSALSSQNWPAIAKGNTISLRQVAKLRGMKQLW